MPPGTFKTYTPDGVVGIVEPQTLRLTSRTPCAVTGVEHGSGRLRSKSEIWNVDPDQQPKVCVCVLLNPENKSTLG